MPHGTTVYFKHPDENSWRIQLAKIEQILADFGACTSQFYKNLNRKYTAELTTGFAFQDGEAEIRYEGELYNSAAFDSVDMLEDETINQLETSFARPLRFPPKSTQENDSPIQLPKTLGISLVYRPGFCSHEILSQVSSRGVWKMKIEIPLDPYWVQIDVEREHHYTYDEVWDYYELVKRIHREVGFSLTAGSFIENYYQFGETEGNRPGFDSLFRFDRIGPSRLILPYEERRPFRTERDEHGNNELSIDPQTGMFRCVVTSSSVG